MYKWTNRQLSTKETFILVIMRNTKHNTKTVLFMIQEFSIFITNIQFKNAFFVRGNESAVQFSF